MRLFHRRGVTPTTLPPINPRPQPPAAPPEITYTVTYDRVGEWGRNGHPVPAPLTVHATTGAQIAAAIHRDVRSYLPAGAAVRVIVDLGIMAGQLKVGALGVGTFGLRMHSGGAR